MLHSWRPRPGVCGERRRGCRRQQLLQPRALARRDVAPPSCDPARRQAAAAGPLPPPGAGVDPLRFLGAKKDLTGRSCTTSPSSTSCGTWAWSSPTWPGGRGVHRGRPLHPARRRSDEARARGVRPGRRRIPWQGHGRRARCSSSTSRAWPRRPGSSASRPTSSTGNIRMLGRARRTRLRRRGALARTASCARGSRSAHRGACGASDERAFAASARRASARSCTRDRSRWSAPRGGPAPSGPRSSRNLWRDGFQGPIYPVNPKADEIDGLKAYPSVTADRPARRPGRRSRCRRPLVAGGGCRLRARRRPRRGGDLGGLRRGLRRRAAPRRTACATSCAPRACAWSDPTAWACSTPIPRSSLERDLRADARRPRATSACSRRAARSASPSSTTPASSNIGISTFVSVGNKADVSGNDLLAYWKDDPRTDVIALYLESFGNPRRFARLAPEVARRKPIVAVKSGRSAAGSRAASSHSAALACLDVAVDALFEQAGVIRTDTLEELFDVVDAPGHAARAGGAPRGRRHQRRRPRHPAGRRLRGARPRRCRSWPRRPWPTLRSLPAARGRAQEPRRHDRVRRARAVRAHDRGGGRRSERRLRGRHLRAADGDHRGGDRRRRSRAGAGTVPADKPVLTVFLSTQGRARRCSPPARAASCPSYSFPENAARALAAAERYGRWRAAPARAAASQPRPTTSARRGARASWSARWRTRRAALARARTTSRRSCAPRASDGAERRIVAPEDAPGVGRPHSAIPLVAKAVLARPPPQERRRRRDPRAQSPRRGRGRRWRRCASGWPPPATQLTAVLLQRQVSGGLEALVGVVGDPTFGPLVVCGLGGVQVELLRDVSFRLPPVTDLDAAEMIDRPALAAALRRLSRRSARPIARRSSDAHPAHVRAGRGRCPSCASWTSTR